MSATAEDRRLVTMDDYGPVVETLRMNPRGTLALWKQHRPDGRGVCPLCRAHDCTLRTLAYEALRSSGSRSGAVVASS